MEPMPTPSRRQLEVLALCAQGKTREQIAGILHISPWTVKDRIDGIRGRLGALTTPHAVALCIARGYLCIDGRDETVFIPEPFADAVIDVINIDAVAIAA